MIRLAYFFVPLPEALPFEDGFTLTIHRILDIAVIEALSESETDDDAALFREYLEISASLKLWHSSAQFTKISAINQLFEVAHKALPNLPDPADRNRETSLTVDSTVVELAVPLDEDLDDPLSAAFDRGLYHLREFQRAYYTATRIPVRLTTREQLPPVVPFAIRTITSSNDEWPQHLSIFHLNTNLEPLIRGELLDECEIERVHQALEAQPGYWVFASFLDQWRRAHNALEAEGDYQASVIYAAIAAEVLLDDLLSHLVWEEGVRPEDAGGVFQDGLAKRVRSQYHPRVGGTWNSNGGGPIKSWYRDIAALRHRVVHAAYEPTIDEARVSLQALKSLQDFIVSRLTSDANIRRYPRTAMAFIGRDGLQHLGQWMSRLEDLQGDPNEPPWVATFARWKATMQKSRGSTPADSLEPKAEESIVVAVFHPGDKVVWVLHHYATAMAHVAEPPVHLSSEQSESLNQLLSEHRDLVHPLSVAMYGVKANPAKNHEWVNEYRLLPLLNVMVDGSDLDSV